MKKLLMMIAALAMTALFAQANELEKVKTSAEKAVKQTTESAPVQKQTKEDAEKAVKEKADKAKAAIKL